MDEGKLDIKMLIGILEEWNEMHPEGDRIPVELQELIQKYLKYALSIGGEKVVKNLWRKIELMPHNNGVLPYNLVLETIRTIDL